MPSLPSQCEPGRPWTTVDKNRPLLRPPPPSFIHTPSSTIQAYLLFCQPTVRTQCTRCSHCNLFSVMHYRCIVICKECNVHYSKKRAFKQISQVPRKARGQNWRALTMHQLKFRCKVHPISPKMQSLSKILQMRLGISLILYSCHLFFPSVPTQIGVKNRV